MKFQLNEKVLEIESRLVKDVAELKARMQDGALLYWTMVHPAHAVLFDPKQNTVAQLAFFRQLWGLQRGQKIRHERYDGIYSVFVPISRGPQSACAPPHDGPGTLFAHSAPAESATEDIECFPFNPSI